DVRVLQRSHRLHTAAAGECRATGLPERTLRLRTRARAADDLFQAAHSHAASLTSGDSRSIRKFADPPSVISLTWRGGSIQHVDATSSSVRATSFRSRAR